MSSVSSNSMRWYAVQCLSNHEDKVKRYLAKYKEEDETFAKNLNEVLVPIETVSEVKNGKKKQRDRKFYPGYVFVEMTLYDESGSLKKEPWYKVKDTDGVINFIGKESPTPLREDEIARILSQVDDAKGKEVPKVQFGIGEMVKILDGPFLNLTGEIEEIDVDKGSLKVSVSIFGRFTTRRTRILASRKSGSRIIYKMSKKAVGLIKLQLPAGSANPAPPVGPALGAQGVNIMGFCKEFNAKTKDQAGMILPVVITVYADKSFSFILKSPPASVLLKKAAGLAKGSGVPNRDKVGKVSREQIKEIVKTKQKDLNAADEDAACMDN